jgi:hypothetical protein
MAAGTVVPGNHAMAIASTMRAGEMNMIREKMRKMLWISSICGERIG